MIDFNEYSVLVATLSQWASEYAAGTPSVSDDVYDKNYLKLKEFEANNPAFILDNSPTRKVIDGAEGFRKVKHTVPMISIANSNGIEEACEWVAETLSRVSEVELEYKLDGLGLALIYNGGQLIDAVTRGVDNVGDSVWENAIRIDSIPKTIPFMGKLEVRGEVVWKFDNFQAYNEMLIEKGKKALVNPRNGAAGALKQHNPDNVAECKLDYIAYLIVEGSTNNTQADDILMLKQLGFEVPPSFVVSTVEDFKRYAEELRLGRFDQEYAIDGEVIKVNDKRLQESFGYTSKCPNFFRAYKFPPEEKETELIDIVESIGMSGAVTPVAILKPVTLAMTTVQRCSLHNWDIVEYLGLFRGCKVVVRKAGEIIPEIVKCVETYQSKDSYEVMRKVRTPDRYVDLLTQNADNGLYEKTVEVDGLAGEEFFFRPEKCPYCGEPLHNAVNDAGEKMVAWVCSNVNCKTQLCGKLTNFASRTVMNIRGLGDSIIEELVESGKVSGFADLYELTVDDLIGLGNFREKSARKLIDSIQASKNNYLHQLIEGFSIPDIGHHISPVIADCISKSGGFGRLSVAETDMDQFTEYCNVLLPSLKAAGVSDMISTRFYNWVISNQYEITKMIMLGVAQNVKESTVTSDKLGGRVCIMTGTFDKLEREAFKEMVVANGGTICSGITKKTNLVLLGDGAGPKKVKAIKELQDAGQKIEVITPSELQKFLDMVK